MRILVTGAAGYVGRAVIRRLTMAGHDVVALVHREPPIPIDAPTLVADLLDPATLAELCQPSHIGHLDGVCHLAARSRVRESFEDPVGYFRTNVTGTLNLLDALRSQSAPPALVLASTGAVYGAPGEEPIAETATPSPQTPYAASKLAAEHAVRWHAETGAIRATVLRTLNVAGSVGGFADPDDTRLITKTLAVAAGTVPHLQVNGDGSAIRDYVHVDDLAWAYVVAVEAAVASRTGVYNVGAGIGTTVREIIAAAERVSGRPVPVSWGPPRPEPRVVLADSSRIREELGWKPERSDLDTILRDAWSALQRPARTAYADSEQRP